MTNFKPGDKILRTHGGIFDPLNIITVGGIYTVRRLNPLNTDAVFIEEDNAYTSYDVDKFVLVEEAPVVAKKWVVGVIDNNGKSFDKRHDTQAAAAADVEDLMELLGDDNRPLIRSIVIKREV